MLSAPKLQPVKRHSGALRGLFTTSALAIALLAAGCGGGAGAGSGPPPNPQPAGSLSPGTLDFGNISVGTSAATQPVRVQNNGNAALTINQISASGDYAVASDDCGSSLAPSAACSINVAFTPSATGTRPGTLQVTDNAPNSPQAVTLTGTGIAQHLVSLQWSPSTTSTVIGYFAYSSPQSGGPYTLMNSVPTTATATSFQGYVPGGQTWYFVVTALDENLIESVPSNEVATVVPP